MIFLLNKKTLISVQMWLTHIPPENVILNFLLYSKKKYRGEKNGSMRKIYESVTLFAQIQSKYGKFEILRVNKVICFFPRICDLEQKKNNDS